MKNLRWITKFLLKIRKMLLRIRSCTTPFWAWSKEEPKAKMDKKILNMISKTTNLKKF